MNNFVRLGDLDESPNERSAFEIPARKLNNIGEVLSIGMDTVTVRVPTQDGQGWEEAKWPKDVPVNLVPRECLETQERGNEAGVDRSSVEGPVALVHKVCDQLGANRKAVLARCAELGINRHTAQTQYYVWKKHTGW